MYKWPSPFFPPTPQLKIVPLPPETLGPTITTPKLDTQGAQPDTHSRVSPTANFVSPYLDGRAGPNHPQASSLANYDRDPVPPHSTIQGSCNPIRTPPASPQRTDLGARTKPSDIETTSAYIECNIERECGTVGEEARRSTTARIATKQLPLESFTGDETLFAESVPLEVDRTQRGDSGVTEGRSGEGQSLSFIPRCQPAKLPPFTTAPPECSQKSSTSSADHTGSPSTREFSSFAHRPPNHLRPQRSGPSQRLGLTHRTHRVMPLAWTRTEHPRFRFAHPDDGNSRLSIDTETSLSLRSSVSSISSNATTFSSSRRSTTRLSISTSSSIVSFGRSSRDFESSTSAFASLDLSDLSITTSDYDIDIESKANSPGSCHLRESMLSTTSFRDTVSSLSLPSDLSQYSTDSPTPAVKQIVGDQGRGPTSPNSIEAITSHSSNPAPDNGVSQIVKSIARLTSELVGVALSEESQPPSQACGTSTTTPANGVLGITTSSSSSGANMASTLPVQKYDTPLCFWAGSPAEATTQLDAPINVFPNAHQFGMRDPNFHVAQRDVQIVKVYNITVNHSQTTLGRMIASAA